MLSTIYRQRHAYNNQIARITQLKKQHVSVQLNAFRKSNIIELHQDLGILREYRLNKKVQKLLSLILERFHKEEILKKYPLIKRIYNHIINLDFINKIETIYLIGSYAQRTANPKSDLDLVIISDENISKELSVVRRSISKLYEIEVDFILFDKKGLSEERKVDSVFYNTTLKYKKDNVVLWDKNDRN